MHPYGIIQMNSDAVNLIYYSNKNFKGMQSPSVKQKDSEVEFTLQNLFIFYPSIGSRYKIKLIVPNFISEESISKQKKRYCFRFPFQSLQGVQGQEGEIYLLQKVKGYEGEVSFREVGKGKFNLLNINGQQNETEHKLINGLIYGIATDLSDKIIAKFSYKMSRKLKETSIQQVNEFLHMSPLSRRRERLPTLTFRQSISNRNVEIHNKLNDLTKDFDETLKKEKQADDRMNKLSDTIDQTLRYHQNESRLFYYKYSEKLQSLIESNAKRLELYKVEIKNIKYNEPKSRNVQKLTSNIYLNPSRSTNIDENINERRSLWIGFYEILQRYQYRRKLLQITVSILCNENNAFSQGITFYLPKTENRILIEIKNIQADEESAAGYIKLDSSLNKIIEIFNEDNQEKGFIIALLQEESQIPLNYLPSYYLQLKEYQTIRPKLKDSKKIMKQKRYSLPTERQIDCKQKNQINTSNVSENSQNEKDTFLKKQKKLRKLIQPSFFGRYKTEQNQNQIETKSKMTQIDKPTNKKPRIREKKQSKISKIEQDNISQDSSRVRIRFLNYDNSRRNIQMNEKLYLQHIFLNLESPVYNLNQKFLTRYELNNQVHLKKAYANKQDSQQNQWNDLGLTFDSIALKDTLKISVFVKENKNESDEDKHLGYCNISIEELKNVKSNTYRNFLISSNTIIGYILLKFSISQSKMVSWNYKSKQRGTSQTNKTIMSTKQQEQHQISISNSFVNAIHPNQSMKSQKQSIQREEIIKYNPYRSNSKRKHFL